MPHTLLDLLFNDPLVFVVSFVGLVVAITIHEFSHAWMADHLGDPTPRSQGRLTLNPLAHMDPWGTLAMLIAGFGWGKPVMFDPFNLKNPRRDAALIALAGPASNLVLAFLLSQLINFNLLPQDWMLFGVGQVIIINIVLAIFNLVPVYPLDGSKILYALLPRETAHEYDLMMRRYGTYILFALIIPWGGMSPISRLISPAIEFIFRLFITV